MSSEPGDIIWVLLVGTDYHRDGVVGVYSRPELAVAEVDATPRPVTGGQAFELEAQRLDSDEPLPAFVWRRADGWRLEYDDKAWRGTDAGVSYMLALCEATPETQPESTKATQESRSGIAWPSPVAPIRLTIRANGYQGPPTSQEVEVNEGFELKTALGAVCTIGGHRFELPVGCTLSKPMGSPAFSVLSADGSVLLAVPETQPAALCESIEQVPLSPEALAILADLAVPDE